MPQQFPDAWKPILGQPSQPEAWLYLYEIAGPDGGALVGPAGESVVVRIVRNSEPVPFGTGTDGEPLVWQPWGINHSGLESGGEQASSSVQVALANAAIPLGSLLPGRRTTVARLYRANDKLLDHRLTITKINIGTLNDPSAKWSVPATIVDSALNSDVLTLDCAAYDYTTQSAPVAQITRRCTRTYRGYGCDYTADPQNLLLPATCGKAPEDCKARGEVEVLLGKPKLHPRRFRGFESAPRGPVKIGGFS